MYLNEDESRPVRAGPQRCLDGGEPGRGCGGVWKRLSKAGSGLGFLAIPASERPRRLREVTRRFSFPLGIPAAVNHDIQKLGGDVGCPRRVWKPSSWTKGGSGS